MSPTVWGVGFTVSIRNYLFQLPDQFRKAFFSQIAVKSSLLWIQWRRRGVGYIWVQDWGYIRILSTMLSGGNVGKMFAACAWASGLIFCAT